MPNISFLNGQFNIRPLDELESHFDQLATSLGQLSDQEQYTDVAIHCKNNVILKANMVTLAYSSELLKDIFSSNCQCPINSFVPVMYDLICPDFDSEAMSVILDLIYKGSAKISISNNTLKDMNSINNKNNILNEIQATLKSLKMENFSSIFEMRTESLQNFAPMRDSLVSEPDNKQNMCQYCSREFLTIEALENHVKRKHIQNQNKFISTSQIKLEPLEHSEEITSNPPYQCNICNNYFPFIESLEEHLVDCDKVQLENVNIPKIKFMSSQSVKHQRSEADPNSNVYKKAKLIETNLEQMKPVKAVGLNTCPICKSNHSLKRNMITHIGISHYKEQLKSTMYGKNKWDCGLCHKTFREENNLISHLANFHNALKKYVPELGTPLKNITVGNNPKLSIPIKSSPATSAPIVAKATQKTLNPKYRCHICPRVSVTLNKHLQHYALSHYHMKLKTKFGNADHKCHFCSGTLTSSNGLLIHLACSHNALEKVVEKEHLHNLKMEAKQVIPSNQTKMPTGELNKDQNQQEESESTTEKQNVSPKLDDLAITEAVKLKPRNIIRKDKSRKPQAKLKFNCHICMHKFPHYSAIMSHYALSHFFSKLVKEYGSKDNLCRICDKVFLSKNGMIAHVASIHNALSDVIPEKHTLLISPSAKI